ncbi:hypothetical protein Trydic_g15446, partial [Trypoxylus dichotomus]
RIISNTHRARQRDYRRSRPTPPPPEGCLHSRSSCASCVKVILPPYELKQ